jgi:DNA-binding transcriptional regulator YhcF (GntR family)
MGVEPCPTNDGNNPYRADGTAAVGLMEIRIHKTSEVPLRQQLAEQILLHIVTGGLKPGFPVPSVRERARRLKIHHNTVSEAYQDLVRRKWLTRRRWMLTSICATGSSVLP